MKRKIWFYVLEVLIILIITIYLAVTKVIPEYQNSTGSSERFFQSKNYETGIEVNVVTGPSFFLVINSENEVTNIFIENEKAGAIANQEIEGKKVNKAIPEIFQKLIEANLIDNQVINIVNYNDQAVYRKVISLVQQSLEKQSKTAQIIESNSTLQDKAKSLNMEEQEDSQILWRLYLNSTEIIDGLPKSTTSTTHVSINKENASVYADTIYQKLVTYMMNANVQNQEKNDMTMPIQYIPGNNDNSVYASSTSWYYIKDYKVYAEITIKGESSYTFCYMGSSTNKEEGICS